MVYPLYDGTKTPYTLPEQPGASTGALGKLYVAHKKLDGTGINVQSDYGCVGDGVANDTAALQAAYDAAAADEVALIVPPGAYKYNGDLEFFGNRVSILGAGSGLVTFLPQSSSRMILRPDPSTIEMGAKIGGFLIQGDGAASGVGIYTGDICQSWFDDIVIQGFDGAGSDGMWFDNYNFFTERNVFTRVWLNHNYRNFRASHTAGGGPDGTGSFGYNRFLDLRINVMSGQTGWVMEDDTILYSTDLCMVCNVTDDGTVFDMRDTAQMNGVHFRVGTEQTIGTGGTGRKIAAGAFVFGYGYARFENGLVDNDDFAGGPRRTPAWRIMQPDGLPAGIDSAHEGVIEDFIGSGFDANIHPSVMDSPQDPYAMFGTLTGPTIRASYVSFIDGPNGAFGVYRVPFLSDSLEDMVQVTRIGARGEMIFPLSESPLVNNGGALGSGPPAASSDGNNTRGTVSVGTGTSPAGFDLAAQVVWAVAYDDIAEVVVTPLTASAALLRTWVVRTAIGFEIWTIDAPTASQPLGTYTWAYHVLG